MRQVDTCQELKPIFSQTATILDTWLKYDFHNTKRSYKWSMADWRPDTVPVERGVSMCVSGHVFMHASPHNLAFQRKTGGAFL